jgi:hypothetical protein
MLLLLLFGVLPILGQQKQYDKDQLYTAIALKADLQFLKTKLAKTHPALYRYTSHAAFAAFFDSLDRAIDRPMKEQEFLSILTLLNDKIKDGHTMLLPGEAAMEYTNTAGRLLPFYVQYVGSKLYITQNSSRDSSIVPGEEIMSINGVGIPALMDQLMARQIRDGYNTTYPAWILNHYFSSYYNFAFGQPAQFLLELKTPAGLTHTKAVAALSKDSIRYYRQLRYGGNLPAANAGQGIVLSEQHNNATAILTIKSFDIDLLRDLYQQDYKRVMDSVFLVLKHHHATHLVLDLRDNQGGDFEPARYLLSYLCVQPAQFLLASAEARLVKPHANHFAGQLFVLMNGGSFSATGMLIATLERDKRAVLIGEETGGNKYAISGDPTELVLPQTGIRCFIATKNYPIIKGLNNGHGVMPTHAVQPSIADVLNGNDPALQVALKLMAQ